MREQLEQEKYEQEAEVARQKELRERCIKKGLSFEIEEAKYQIKLSEKIDKEEAKLTKKKFKNKS